MKLTAAAAVTTLLATAMAQDNPLGVPLPSDIAAYASSLATNTQAFAALEGIFTNPGVLSVVKAAPTLQPGALVIQFQSAVQAAIAAEPSAQQPVASSVYNRLGQYALTDNFLGALAGATSAPASGATSAPAVTTSAPVVSSNGTAASNGTVTGAATSGGARNATATGAGSGSGSASASGAGGSPATGTGSGAASGTSARPAATTSAAAGGAAGMQFTGAGAALLAGGLFAVAAL